MQREHLGARAGHRNETGFTLIELMMVIFIIAILIAVLTPVFLGATNRAKDRASQSSLRNALTAAKTVFSDKADYTQADKNTLTATVGVGSVTFIDGAKSPNSTNCGGGNVTNCVSVDNAEGPSVIVFGGQSKTGACFYIADVADNTAGTAPGTVYAKQGGSGGCYATGAPAIGDPAWKSTW
jgi:type IV pilus assembly protein PilA